MRVAGQQDALGQRRGGLEVDGQAAREPRLPPVEEERKPNRADAVRSAVTEVFGCRVYEEYSAVENCVFASECEHGSLHVSPDCGYVEILRP